MSENAAAACKTCSWAHYPLASSASGTAICITAVGSPPDVPRRLSTQWYDPNPIDRGEACGCISGRRRHAFQIPSDALWAGLAGRRTCLSTRQPTASIFLCCSRPAHNALVTVCSGSDNWKAISAVSNFRPHRRMTRAIKSWLRSTLWTVLFHRIPVKV